MHVAELRKKIDALDQRVVKLLNARARVAMQIGRLKQVRDSEVYVSAREKAVLAHVRRASRGPLSKDAIAAIYREIMSASLALERRLPPRAGSRGLKTDDGRRTADAGRRTPYTTTINH